MIMTDQDQVLSPILITRHRVGVSCKKGI
jgi:hypothetical protein